MRRQQRGPKFDLGVFDRITVIPLLIRYESPQRTSDNADALLGDEPVRLLGKCVPIRATIDKHRFDWPTQNTTCFVTCVDSRKLGEWPLGVG